MSTTVEAAGLPVYERRDVPEHLQHLRTMTDLKKQRLKPAEGQLPVALLRVYRRGHGWGEFPLYDPADAAKMRPLSAKQQAAMEARRTCPRCGEVRNHVVGRQCGPCDVKDREEHMALQARTCWKCRRVSAAPLPSSAGICGAQDRCTPCWVWWRLQQQCEAERLAAWRRTCPGSGCEVVTATDEEIAAVRADPSNRVGWVPRWCPPCAERDALERAERQRAYEEAQRQAAEDRRLEVARLEEWARSVLADPDTVILDTETTGLDGDPRIVDLGVLSIHGEPLLDTLVNPGEPIPPEATDIHGIADEDVVGAPSFGAVLEQLSTVLAGRRCLIYNAPYDVGRLRHELTLHYLDRAAREAAEEAARTGVLEGVRERAVAEAVKQAAAWLDGMRFEDAMIPYSNWCGDWSDYWGNYSWQPLPGGDHRAISDCRAVVDVLRAMAAGAGAAAAA
ncbi:exonuclease domain-containing protein [Streptomyces sp. NPDC007851]|uniref:exonuclease domain-containing protein n=1 Tax=Streptomyces sp. NPDC007851 TaxID=3155008 RepID=UPI0033C28D66